AGDDGKAAVTSAIREKLALQDVAFSWHMDGRNHYVTATQSPRPPSKVLFSDADVQILVNAAKESAPLIGLSHRNTTVSVDLDAESPHVLVSAGTGGGKSVILRGIFAQLLHNGAEGTVLDRKRHSHKWARGIPGVEYCRDIEDIHDSLIRLGIEGERRNRIVDDWEGEGDAPVGPRHVILLEEVNATIGKLKRYWVAIRTKEDPKESPAIDALAEILFMGRAVKMHVLAVGQSMTANSMGGPEMRENFATRILARATRNAWNMLVPEVQPAPKFTRHIGRAQVVLGGVAHETQVLFMTEPEAHAWAMVGRSVAASQGRSTPSNLEKDPTTVATTGPAASPATNLGGPAGAAGLPGPRITEDDFVAQMEAAFSEPATSEKEKPISLSEAVKEEIVTTTLHAVRRASLRDDEFPPSVGKAKNGAFLYWPADLRKWERNRVKAGNSANEV
ncbi:pRL2-11, partial [Kitasatospora sp. NPDC058402]